MSIRLVPKRTPLVLPPSLPRDVPPACRALPRRSNVHAALLPAAIVVLSAGCASVDPEPAFQDVRETVSTASGLDVEWRRSEHRPSALTEPVELGRADLVRMALERSPNLQARFEELGIAVADLAQASRLENPMFGASRKSVEGGTGFEVDLGLAQNLVRLLTLGARNDVARIQLEEVKLRVADQVLDLARDVELAAFELTAARQQVDMRSLVAETQAASLELALRMRDAGNATELAVRREQSLHEAAQIDLLQARSAVLDRRRHLRDLVGLETAEEDQWTVTPRLPQVPATEETLADLEELAVERRLDLAAALQEVAAVEQALGIQRRWRFVDGLEIGVGREREVDGEWVIGPKVSLALPIFDQGQPRIARGAARLRQAERHAEAIALGIRSEVRYLVDEVRLQRELAQRVLEKLIPARQRTVRLEQQRYNYMLAGIFEVLQAKRDEIDAYALYIDTVRDYWLARTRLRFAVGGAPPLEMDGDIVVPKGVDGVSEPAAMEEPLGSHQDHEHHNSEDHQHHAASSAQSDARSVSSHPGALP